jgi:SAM-dependent methyltransferase
MAGEGEVSIAEASAVGSIAKLPVECPVCDGKKFTVLYEPWVDIQDPVQLYGAASGIQGTQTLVTCSDCGMIYENPRYPESVIIQGYMSSDESGHDSQRPMRVASFYNALMANRSLVPGVGAKVLDIGTAGGAYLEAATKFGYDAWGMEPSEMLVAEGKKRGLNIEQGTIDRHQFEPGSFDMVSLWDVLEHVVDAKACLRECRRLLKPGGVLLINYPDIGTWQAKLAGKKFWWILSVHIHHFDRKSIVEICKRTGFEVFSQRPYWQTLEFGYLEGMAAHLKVPLANLAHRLTPGFVQRIPLPYYASQTTAIARLS